MSRGGGRVCPEGMSHVLPCDLSHDAYDVTYLSLRGHTYTCENITFPELLLWAVITIVFLSF